MADVHRDTLVRLDRIRQLGYHVVTIWECTWVQQKSDACEAEFVEHHDVVAPLDPSTVAESTRYICITKQEQTRSFNTWIIPAFTPG